MLPLPHATSKRLLARDMCVTVHQHQVANSSHLVSVEPRQAAGVDTQVAILSICNADVAALKQSMRSWSTRPALVFTLKGLRVSAVAQELLQKCVHSRAFPDSPASQHLVIKSADTSSVQAMSELENLGATKRTSLSRDEATWALTPRGVSQLHHMHEVSKPALFLRPCAELAALAPEELPSLTSWELFQVLRQKGWVLKRASGPPKKMRLLPPVTREPLLRQWYSTSVNLTSKNTRSYMLALAQVDELFAGSFVQCVYHCQKQAYYEHLLDGTSTGDLPEDLMLEDGDVLEANAHARQDALKLDVQAPAATDSQLPLCLEPAVPAEPPLSDGSCSEHTSNLTCEDSEMDDAEDKDSLDSLYVPTSPRSEDLQAVPCMMGDLMNDNLIGKEDWARAQIKASVLQLCFCFGLVEIHRRLSCVAA